MKWISLVMLAGMMSGLQAATIGVIDSGLDYKHEMIVPNLWTNPNETFDNRDNDANGYQDDVHGWNFAEQNGRIIEYSYLGTFSSDPEKFFDIQGKAFLKEATEEELAWVKSKREDKKFIAEMGKFGNFVHGTHVAGIAVRGTNNKAMGLKLIPTETKIFFERARTMAADQGLIAVDRWELMAKLFDTLGAAQMGMLGDIATLAHAHKADVLNGSFGMGFHQAKIISDKVYTVLFLKKPAKEDSDKAARLLIETFIKNGSKFVGAAPNTLFVFAAGNDGLSNDEFGTSPANIKADNVITVGATYKNQFFAPFSNFGTKMVDVAAPGMLIHSAIPGTGTYLKVSGTSQASPFVAGMAGKIKDINPSLVPADIKKIIMGTVDKKGFLSEKVMTGGIVNDERAYFAANLSKKIPVAEAITRSRSQVKDAPVVASEVKQNVVTPIPLTPSIL